MRSKAAIGWGTGLGVLGVLCLAAAAVLVWVIVPNSKQLPADTDTTRQFDGMAAILLNPQALASGDLRAAVVRDAPVSATRTVKVVNTDGDVAQVEDRRALSVAGQQVGQTDAMYAVDRSSLGAVEEYPSDWTVVDHEGLTVSWPIGSDKSDYTGWINETQSTAPIRYVRDEEKAGLDTYVYQLQSQPAPIKDEQVLATLPRAIPRGSLAELAQNLPLPDATKAQLGQALPQLPDPVPLSYQYQVSSTFWVEPTTGVVVDTEREEVRIAGLTLPNGTVVGEVPVYSVTTAFTDQSVQEASNDADDSKSTIDLVGTALPLALAVLGVILLAAAVVLIIAGRRSPARTTQ